ncbi:MAG: SLBB domain-containing protein [Clostridia bacterium]|nr:SLBB domain-containing protein [Clostridia bacterium]
MELRELMKEAGLVGAGGAGFPSYAKLNEGAKTLVINGSECEPLLYTDYAILERELDTVLTGIKTVLDGTGIKNALLCVKPHTAKSLSLSDGESLGGGTRVKILPDSYPIGDEISLIFEAIGKVVRPGALPISVGAIVYNVETMYNLGRYVLYSEPVFMKWLTVGGDVKSPCVIKVPVGTRVSDLFKRLGITVDGEHTVIDGGPSMGKIINPATATVKKTTSGLLVLPKNIQASEAKLINEKLSVARAETACCQCTRCTDMCPRHLLGYPLEPHKMVRTAMGAAKAMPEMVINATLCCGCGICESLACSQGISPKAVINNYKELLSQNKMRYSTNTDVDVRAEREYRMIPTAKWKSALGIAKFDTPPVILGEISDFDRVEIPLSAHIGAPSVPTVKNGATVRTGEKIADASSGLSVPQHASVTGHVSVLSDKIIICKVK